MQQDAHWYCDHHATLLSHSRESFGSKLCGPRRIRATWKVATKEAEEEEATTLCATWCKIKRNKKKLASHLESFHKRRRHSAPRLGKCLRVLGKMHFWWTILLITTVSDLLRRYTVKSTKPTSPKKVEDTCTQFRVMVWRLISKRAKSKLVFKGP